VTALADEIRHANETNSWGDEGRKALTTWVNELIKKNAHRRPYT